MQVVSYIKFIIPYPAVYIKPFLGLKLYFYCHIILSYNHIFRVYAATNVWSELMQQQTPGLTRVVDIKWKSPSTSRFQIARQQHLTLALPNSQIHFIKNLDSQLYQIYDIRILVSYNLCSNKCTSGLLRVVHIKQKSLQHVTFQILG